MRSTRILSQRTEQPAHAFSWQGRYTVLFVGNMDDDDRLQLIVYFEIVAADENGGCLVHGILRVKQAYSLEYQAYMLCIR